MTRANEPAFPREGYFQPDGKYVEPVNGMTIREHFAGLAMQGMLAAESNDFGYGNTTEDQARLAVDSVRAADALIAELAKGGAA